MYYYVVSAVVGGTNSADSAQAAAITFSPTLGSLVHRYSFSETGGTTVADSVGGAGVDRDAAQRRHAIGRTVDTRIPVTTICNAAGRHRGFLEQLAPSWPGSP